MKAFPFALSWAVLLLALAGRSVQAADADKAGPETVHVGAYINRIFDVNLKENRFSIDCYLWFRWNDDELKPHESFQLTGGKVDEKTEVQAKKTGDTNYASVRLVVTISKYWDVRQFPLDNHKLNFTIEESVHDTKKVKYLADDKNSGINKKLRFPGWEIIREKSKVEISEESYTSNYGDISLPQGKETQRSRFRYSIQVDRPGYGLFWKMFTGLFVATLLAFLAFFIKVTDVDPRFGLGVGSMFAAVASQYVASSILPDTHEISLADKLHMVTFVLIFLTILQSTYSLKLFQNGQEEASKKFDLKAFLFLFPLCLIVDVLLVIYR